MDTYAHGNATTSSSGSSGCSPGYYKYSTSNGHCCREEFPYYYDGLCQSCQKGYGKYNSSNGHCCPDGSPVYYNDACHACPEGYEKTEASNGHCCAEEFPYYYDGSCWNQPAGSGGGMMSGTTGSGTTGSSSTGVSTPTVTGGEGGPQLVRGKCPSGTYYYQGACWKQSSGSSTTSSGTGTQKTYYASCSECQGQYRLYSYRGPSYGVCNNYYQACLQAGCQKILYNCA